MYADDPDVKKVIDTARGIEGLIRGTGVHAAGVILSSEPLVDVMPIHRRADDGARITGFDGPSCEYMGSLKMDFLGLRNLTVISDAVLNVKANRGVDVDMLKLPLDDAKAYELLAAGKTLGVFQLDSTMMRDLTKLMAPTRFEDISAVLALGRPGPMEAKSHINYALRKSGQQPVSPVHPELKEPLEEILGETYHLVVYQEQVMAIARKLAGYTLGGADILRRAMGKKKKEEMDKQWAMFSSGMKDNGYSEEATQAVWDVLLPFSAYGFNKSHTAGVRARLLLDRLPQGELPRRVHGRPADLGRHQQGQDGRLPGRDPADGRQGAAARRQRVSAAVRGRRRRHQVRARRDPQRGRERRRRRSSPPAPPRAGSAASTTS